MFEITRLATTATKCERKIANYINKNNINTNTLKGTVKDLYESVMIKKSSKNPIKKVFDWCKTFLNNFKVIKDNFKTSLNDIINDLKENGCPDITSSSKVKKSFFKNYKKTFKDFNTSIKEFIAEKSPTKTKKVAEDVATK